MKPNKFKSGMKLMAEVCGIYPITQCPQFPETCRSVSSLYHILDSIVFLLTTRQVDF